MLIIKKHFLSLQCVFHGIRLLRLIEKLVVVRQSIFFVQKKINLFCHVPDISYLCAIIDILKETIVKKNIIILLISTLPLASFAQKISLGSCITYDKGQYKGEMVGGKPHGKGNTIFDNGNTYEGEYVKGHRQGFGVYTFAEGEKYEGEWMQDQPHGRGTYYFLNNNKYVGLWFREKQQGHGIMYYYNGDIYDGEWHQDKRQGKGKYTFA